MLLVILPSLVLGVLCHSKSRGVGHHHIDELRRDAASRHADAQSLGTVYPFAGKEKSSFLMIASWLWLYYWYCCGT
jgi:hypothetical protein